MKTLTFNIRNISTAETLSFDAESVTDALDMASLHFFGEKPSDRMRDKNEVYTLLRNSSNGNVIGRLIIIGTPS
jgi:hypothetical protein